MRPLVFASAALIGCATEHPRPPAPFIPEVYIEYRADRSDAVLERRYRNWDWIPVCSSPCARTVRPDFEYRVGGEWLVPSKPFVLYRPTTIDAQVGTRSGRALGIIAVTAGIPLMIFGLFFTSMGLKEDERSGALEWGISGLALGGAMTGVGAVTIAANRTDVELRDRSPVAKVTVRF